MALHCGGGCGGGADDGWLEVLAVVGDVAQAQLERRPQRPDHFFHFVLHPVTHKHVLDVIAVRRCGRRSRVMHVKDRTCFYALKY